MAETVEPVGSHITPPAEWFGLQLESALTPGEWIPVEGDRFYDEEDARAKAYELARNNRNTYRIVRITPEN